MEHKRHYGIFKTDPGRNPYEIRTQGEGWFLYEDLADLMQQKMLYTSKQYDWLETRLVSGHTSIRDNSVDVWSNWWPLWDHWLKIERGDLRAAGERESKELKGLILKPYVAYLSEANCKAEFVFDPVTTGTPSEWDFVQSADGLFTEMVHGKGPATTADTYLELVETSVTWNPDGGLCPNLFFAVGFRRQAFDDDMLSLISAISGTADTLSSHWGGTMVFFGGSPRSATPGEGTTNGFRWRLVFPLKDKPKLQECFYAHDGDMAGTWFTREWTSGELEALDPGKMAKDGNTYHIGVIGDCICVSENRFEDNFAIYRASDKGQPVVASGAVRVYHWPGQFACWMAPLGFAKQQSGYASFVQRTAIHTGNVNLALIGNGDPIYGWLRAKCWCYTLKGMHDPTKLIWGPKPAEWPAVGWWLHLEWVDGPGDHATIAWGPGGPPDYPPYGPPGQWPVYPPFGWPAGEAWPPAYAAPAGVAGSVGHHSGGDVIFDLANIWAPDAPVGGNHPEWLQWRVLVTPSVWTPLNNHIKTYSTPFIMATTVWQGAEITRNVVNPLWVSEELSVSMSEPELCSNGSCNAEVTLKNPPNDDGTFPSDNLRPGAISTVTAGTVLADGNLEYVTFGGMVIAEATPSSSQATCRLTDPLGMMELAKWDSGYLNLRGWSPREAIWCVLSLYGMDNHLFFEGDNGTGACTLEDLGEVLYGDGWEWQSGTSIRSIVSDIAKRGTRGGSIWWDPLTCKIRTGCRYCRSQRTSATWASHQDNGWRSSGCLAEDVVRTTAVGNPSGIAGIDHVVIVDNITWGTLSMLFATEFSGRNPRLSGEYANRVTVQGKTFDGYPIWFRLESTTSTGASATFEPSYYVGWRVTKVVDVKGEGTWVNIQETMTEESDSFGERGLEVPGVPVPLATYLRPANTVIVRGADWNNADGLKFRLKGVKHDVVSGLSTLNLRQLLGKND